MTLRPGDRRRIDAAVRLVEDPEIPVTLADFGVLRGIEHVGDTVRVILRPTRLGCPARDRMERDVVRAAREADPHVTVEVLWETAPWTEADVTPEGRRILTEYGYSDGTRHTVCPYCGSAAVTRAGAFGGALCKLPWTCRSCGSTFDALRSTIVQVRVGVRT